MNPDPSLLVVPRVVLPQKRIRHITVIYNVVQNLNYGEKEDLLADEDTVSTAREIFTTLKESGFAVDLFELNEKKVGKIFELKTDLIFNLAYGIGSVTKTEAEVVKILEKSQLPFTGAGSRAIILTTDKVATKKKFIDNNIPTPKFQIFVSPEDQLEPQLKFPLIVKPKGEDCSLGIHNNSVVISKAGLGERLEYLIRTYREPLLVEEYIEGRELNITIIGNNSHAKVLPISEIIFGSSFKIEKKWKIVDFEAKWLKQSDSYKDTPGVCPADLDVIIEQKIKELVLKAYKKCGCRDYARIDVRLGTDNTPFFLEVNLNPGIGPTDGAIRSAKAAGYDYQSFLKEIVKTASARL